MTDAPDAPEAPNETGPEVFTYEGVRYLPSNPTGHPDSCNRCAGHHRDGNGQLCIAAPSCGGAIYVKDTRGNRVKHTIWRLSK
jgi:hypothetical protein